MHIPWLGLSVSLTLAVPVQGQTRAPDGLAAPSGSTVACTAQEARQKAAIAWDRASLLEMRDLNRGRLLHQRILAMHLAGQTTGPNVDWGKLCVEYDDITKAAR